MINFYLPNSSLIKMKEKIRKKGKAMESDLNGWFDEWWWWRIHTPNKTLLIFWECLLSEERFFPAAFIWLWWFFCATAGWDSSEFLLLESGSRKANDFALYWERHALRSEWFIWAQIISDANFNWFLRLRQHIPTIPCIFEWTIFVEWVPLKFRKKWA